MATSETLEQDPPNPPTQQPHSETPLEEENPPNPPTQHSDKDNDDDETALLILDEQPPMTSPTNRRTNKKKGKKKGNKLKNKFSIKKVQNLTDIINPIPFSIASTKKKLDLVKYEGVLKKLGLYDFTKIQFDPNIQTDLIVQLIVNYDPKKRSSYVNDYKINVNRPTLARALKLPVAKQDKATPDQVDLDSEVFSDDDIGFVENFVMNWILLGEGPWDLPPEIVNWTRCIRDGHPEKLDSASLIWYKVEKELSQGDKLVDCYYASHLQYLIKSQREKLFNVGVADINLKAEQEEEEEEQVQEHNVDLTLGQDVEEIVDEEVKEDDREMVDAQDFKVVEEVPDVEEIVDEEVKEDDREMADAQDFKVVEEVPEIGEQGNWEFGGNKILGDHYLQRCQNSDLNNFEETKVEDEQVEQVDDEEEEVGVRVDEEDEDVGVSVDEGFDMEANDDSLEDRDGLTGNYLQGVETSHVPFNSHGISSMDLFGSRDASFMSHDAVPSFFNNGGKRTMEPEEDVHHLDGNIKRLKTDAMWDQKPNDFGLCMEQVQQWVEKAKMLYESKEQSYANSQYDQQVTMNEMQERQNFMEIIIKSKDEELQRKNNEVFRLERELYLMGDLVQGYRKALNDTRLKFSEYRKRYALKEEPLYKDAGPGGLVLSTRELEKRRLKQDEDRVKFIAVAKTLEDEFLNVFEKHHNEVLLMVDKLVFVENELKRLKELLTQRKETQKGWDEQELFAKPEENQKSTYQQELNYVLEDNHKSVDEHELTPEPEENQKSVDEQGLTAELEENQKSQDEILENDASVESVSLEADESKEKGGGDD